MHLWLINLYKEARLHSREKTVSSVNSDKKTGQLLAKNEIITFTNTIHKNKLEMD